MADTLKRENSLLVLRVSFAQATNPLRLDLTLERHGPESEPTLGEWSVRCSSLGVPAELKSEPMADLHLPIKVAKDLAKMLAERGGPSGEPLWLHLVKPYGHLGALRWERVLGQLSGRPIVRLPDFLEKPHETEDVLCIALLCDLVLDGADVAAVAQVVRCWLDAPRRIRIGVHLFATHAFAALRDAFDADARVHVHSPVSLRRQQGEQPYFSWVMQSVGDEAIDVVHVLATGHVSNDRSSLKLSHPSEACDRDLVGYVSCNEMATFMNRLGAWAFALAGPPDGSSEAALRHFADALAQRRPGPSLFHTLDEGTIAAEFLPSCGMLFSPDCYEIARFETMLLYCQPALVASGLHLEAPTLPALASNAGLFATGPASAPNWVASAQRFAEKEALQIKRLASDDVLLRDPFARRVMTSPSDDSAKIVTDTLGRMQNIVAQHLRRSHGSES